MPEFISFSVAAKIVMIIEYKNFMIRICLTVKIGCCKSADTATDYYEVIFLLNIIDYPFFTHYTKMHIFPAAVVTAT